MYVPGRQASRQAQAMWGDGDDGGNGKKGAMVNVLYFYTFGYLIPVWKPRGLFQSCESGRIHESKIDSK